MKHLTKELQVRYKSCPKYKRNVACVEKLDREWGVVTSCASWSHSKFYSENL